MRYEQLRTSMDGGRTEMRVAVVGAGVAGLVCAYLVSDLHDVTVFEANDWAGGHAHTIPVVGDHGAFDVDTGFVVFNDRNYPLFTKLLHELNVGAQPTSMSFSVSDASGSFEFSSGSINGVFAVRSHLWSPRFHRVLADALRCQR